MIHLPTDTVQLLTSGQIITCVSSLVKELIENALDARAEHVEVILEKFGLNRVQIVDNGNGIPKCEISQVCKRYHTTKLTKYEDLAQIGSYGFRGEALHSICSLATLVISSRTSDEEIGEKHSFDHDGNLVSSQPVSMVVGTRITVTNIFSNLPVRRQLLSTPNNGKEEIKRITHIIQSYKIAHPNLRFTFTHDLHSLLQFPKVNDLGSAITLLFGSTVLDGLNHTYVHRENFSLTGYIPCANKQTSIVTRANKDSSILIVNKRPGSVPNFMSFFRKFFVQQLDLPSRVYPIYFLYLEVPADRLDINVSADKGTLYLHDQTAIVEAIREEWEIIYRTKVTSDKTSDSVVPVITSRLELLSHSESGDDILVSTDRDIILNPNSSEIVEESVVEDWNPDEDVLSGNLVGEIDSKDKSNILTFLDTTKDSGTKKRLNSTIKDPQQGKKRKSTQSPNTNTIPFSITPKNITRPSPDQVILTPSLDSIRKSISESIDLKSPIPGPSPSPVLVGNIETNKFIFSLPPSLYIGDEIALLEQSIYFTLFQDYFLEACPLTNPIVIPRDQLTVDFHRKILNIKHEKDFYQPTFSLIDDSIVKNGFEIEVSFNSVSEEIDRVEITSLANLYGEEGVEQFLLLLDRIDQRSVTEAMVRPDLIQEYLRKEAIERSNSGTRTDSKSLQEIIITEWEREKIDGSSCSQWYHYFKTL